MQLGLVLAGGAPTLDMALAQRAEAAGFDAV